MRAKRPGHAGVASECADRLKPLLVSVATAANPLDLTPTTAFRPEAMAQLPQALDILAGEAEIQSLLFVVGSMAAKASEISDVVCELAERADKPVCVSWPSPPRAVPARLADRGIYSFLDPARGIRALAKWVEHGANLRRPSSAATIQLAKFDWQGFAPAEERHAVIPEPTCHRILAAAGLTVAAGELVGDEANAVRAADAVGRPVVLKGITPRDHASRPIGSGHRRSALGGRRARRLSSAHARAAELSIALDGVLVQKLYARGTELIVTAFRDPVFGVMVSCGSGGGLTELIDDVVTARAPVGIELAAHMLERLRTRRHSTDSNGLIETAPAARFVARFSELAATAPWDRFVFEVNPVLWRRDDAVALDGLLIVG